MAATCWSSTAVEGLFCSVCGDSAHGQHFGAITCRPCSSFFRRCVVNKLTYKCIKGGTNCCNIKIGSRKRCKACRFMVCQKAGMKFRSKYGGNADLENVNNEHKEMPFVGDDNCENYLDKFVAAHSKFLMQQKSLFITLHGESGQQEIKMIIPETELTLIKMENATKPLLIAMFEMAIPPFCRMDKEIRKFIFDDCFDQLNLLNAAFFSLEYFDRKEDRYFQIAFGLIMDLNSLEEIIEKWSNSSHIFQQVKQKYQRVKCEQMKGIYAFIKQLKKMPQKLRHQDFCAMMAIFVATICSKSVLSKFDLLEWENYLEKISSEWLQSLNSIFNSEYLATIQMSHLLSILHQLDIFCRNLKKKPYGPPSLLQICASENLLNKFGREANEIKSFCRLANCYRRIWGSFMNLADNYLDKFSKLEDLLMGSDNLLGLAETFKLNPVLSGTERIKLFSEFNQMYKTNLYHPRIMKSMIVYNLLAIGFLKAMPTFNHLTTNEKAFMVKQLRLPINYFINSFFSVQLGSKCWIGTDGITPMEICRAVPEYRNDERFMFLVDRTFVKCMDPFLRIPLLKFEEFGILLAILCSHQAISGLSKGSQDLLYTEQVRLSQILLKYLQIRLGHVEGAKRYAECLHLVDSTFGSAQNHEIFIAYAETFHIKHGYNLGFPKSISVII